MSGTTSTQWALGEFDKHHARLTDVGKQVDTAGQHLNDAMGSNADAFGKLFGWAVAPALDMLFGDVQGFSKDLGEAMDASAEGISEARKAYAQTEQDNVDRSRQVEGEISAQRAKVN